MASKPLQYLMGHADITTTLNVYKHICFEDAEKEVKKLTYGFTTIERFKIVKCKMLVWRRKTYPLDFFCIIPIGGKYYSYDIAIVPKTGYTII